MSERINCENKRICYYITGHGFGHLTRCAEILFAILRYGYNPSQIDIVSNLDVSLLKYTIHEDINVFSRLLDTGAIQSNALAVDPLASLQAYYNKIYLNHDTLLLQEISFLRERQTTWVLVDATPIACHAAAKVGIPSIIISNFTWCYIYREMVDMANTLIPDNNTEDTPNESIEGDIRSWNDMIQSIENDYSHASAYYLLPGATPTPTPPSSPLKHLYTVAAPLVGRGPRRAEREVRAELGVGPVPRLILLGFGGQSSEWRLREEYVPPGFVCVVLGSTLQEVPERSEKYIYTARDVYVPDILQACDVLIGKLGYGTLSECIISKTALIYISRSGWPEERWLEKEIRERESGIELEREKFIRGEWEDKIKEGCEITKRMRERERERD